MRYSKRRKSIACIVTLFDWFPIEYSFQTFCRQRDFFFVLPFCFFLVLFCCISSMTIRNFVKRYYRIFLEIIHLIADVHLVGTRTENFTYKKQYLLHFSINRSKTLTTLIILFFDRICTISKIN